MNIPEELAKDILTLLWESGLFDNLKDETKQYLVEIDAGKLIEFDQTKRLEPRFSLEEYVSHIVRLLNPPNSQREFYRTIVKICYFMILVEKNPLIANELRGTLQMSDQLSQILK